LGRAFAALQRVESAAPTGLRVGYRIAHQLVRAELERIPAAGGRYLTQGVTVSTFLPMRAVPFKVVFLAGMGEGAFPARDAARELDLRAGPGARRVPGDVSPREQDQYVFLETLLCARERLYVSYVDRHEAHGEPLGPSSTVLELLELLERGYLRGGREAVTRAAPPLRRHEDGAACAVIPAAARERRAARLGRTLEEETAGRTVPEWPALRKALAPDALAALAPALGWTAPRAASSATPTAEPTARTLTFRHVLRFLQCPLQGSASVLLPFSALEVDDEAAAAFREHEDFDLPWPRAMPLLREALRGRLRARARARRRRARARVRRRLRAGGARRDAASRHVRRGDARPAPRMPPRLARHAREAGRARRCARGAPTSGHAPRAPET
jgi:exodeoxyribonuclease V gamma subunit